MEGAHFVHFLKHKLVLLKEVSIIPTLWFSQAASRYYSAFASPDIPPTLDLADSLLEATLSAGNFDLASLFLRDLTYMDLCPRNGVLDLRALPVATAQVSVPFIFCDWNKIIDQNFVF